jgi:hypothetical protein
MDSIIYFGDADDNFLIKTIHGYTLQHRKCLQTGTGQQVSHTPRQWYAIRWHVTVKIPVNGGKPAGLQGGVTGNSRNYNLTVFDASLIQSNMCNCHFNHYIS